MTTKKGISSLKNIKPVISFFRNNILTISFFLVALAMFFSALYSVSTLQSAAGFLLENTENRLISASNHAAAFVSNGVLSQFNEAADMNKPEYIKLKQDLINFAEENSVLFVYYYKPITVEIDGEEFDFLQPIIDNDESEDAYTLDTEALPIEEDVQIAIDSEKTNVTTLGYYSTGFDGIISAFTPIFDDYGNLEYIAGVDILDTQLLEFKNSIPPLFILLSILVVLVIASGAISIISHKKKEKVLSVRLDQLKLTMELSQSFLAGDDRSRLIGKALCDVGNFMSVTHIAIFRTADSSSLPKVEHFWSADNSDLEFDNIIQRAHLIAKSFAESSFDVANSSNVVCSDVTLHPVYNQFDKTSGVKAFIAVPLYVNNSRHGILLIEECKKPRIWQESTMQLVSVIGNMIAEAITHMSTEYRLRLMSSIVENSPQLICHLNSDGSFGYINQSGQDLFGFSIEELSYQGMQKLFGWEETIRIFETALPFVRENGKGEFIINAQHKNGRKYVMRFHAFMIDNGTGGIGIIGDDITEKLIMEKEREDALAEAKRSSKAKSEFLANMSHEMRTPMNAIIGMTSIGKSTAEMERKDYCLGKISDASAHLLGVINDILDMSKIEANKLELSDAEFDFEKLLQKVVNVINFKVDEKSQTFTVHLDKWLPQILIGDDQRLAQVITNLLSNAVKFTPDGGTIYLDASLIDELDGVCTIKISVTDSGIGISDEQQSRLFDSFTQADSGISRKFGGTGLGLAISQRIVEIMGGEISVSSKLGEGASFSFSIKMKRATKTKANLLRPGVNWDNVRILAVDDALDILEYFADIAKRLGVQCDTASSAEMALELVMRTGAYDIYFIDWKMPVMDGLELSRRIKAVTSNKSVVIMISVVEWSVIENEAKKAGIDKFIPKPLFPSAIANCINECIGLENLLDAGNAKKSEDTLDSFENYKIILAEDVEINREIIITLLEPTGITIDCAENGLEAVNLFISDPDKYDMIFMDVQMPIMDGYEATTQIRAADTPRAKTIPIIAMTANVFREDIEKCISVGMNAHIGKPLDFDDVLQKIRDFTKPIDN
ncbi:MAG: response regulator [Christensenellaceae bacterium]|jgi:PAS domain S-box-containing protein|nr:response regulator [Christensenellaceae bacterium]